MKRVLIVEDKDSIAREMEAAGEQLHIAIDCASDGWDAIEKLESETYRAIVIDADVARHSGYGVLTYLREEIGGELGNVIVMTSCDCDDLRRRVGDGMTVVATNDAVRELTRMFRSAVAEPSLCDPDTKAAALPPHS
ncbi:MAG TPA: response regulator [Thermoanaerobaculia bacterium]|nr:response regulator [Thermoanaerobaculia bacterium]